jgi:hypothetical protein
MKREFEISNRRGFFGVMAKTGAIISLTPLAASAVTSGSENPFAYDLSRFGKTDPKLITHEVAARWPGPRKNTRYLTAAPDDQLYLCADNYLTACNTAGKPGLEIALPETVCCAAVANDGKIYAGLRSSIQVFDAQGSKLIAWNSPDRKSWFTGIAVGEQEVFVADSGKRVVLRFAKDGSLINRIGEKKSGKNAPGFAVPSPYLNVFIHRDGLLRVNNTGRHQVEAYSFDGEFSGAWGKFASAIGGFCGCCNPIAIAALPDGRFVTAEKGLPRVKIYSSSGEFESVVAGVESFPENARACSSLNDCVHGGLGLAVDSRERIYILDFVTNEVRVMQRKA